MKDLKDCKVHQESQWVKLLLIVVAFLIVGYIDSGV
jgi:hypothetical protein